MNSFIIPANETPEQAAARKQQAVRSALLGGALPQTIGEGISSLGDGLAARQQGQGAMFPSAPGGAQPSFMTAMQNLFGRGNKGLY